MEWISAEDWLPLHSDPVLVYCVGGDNEEFKFCEIASCAKLLDEYIFSNDDNSWNISTDNNINSDVKVTHWQPLPAPPKESE